MRHFRPARARVAACLFVAFGAAAQADTAIFINEIHYDDSGTTDSNEHVEIAGPAGTDLTGWTVVLYNGSGGLKYDTINLSGTIPANCGSYGVVSTTPPGGQIQNGAPDGAALVNGSGTVIQFLSWEGTFTAHDGPANNMLSVDIGVAESNSTPVGSSLSLKNGPGGSGTVYGDFVWQAPAANTFGSCNAGQTFGTPVDVPPVVAVTTPANNATGIVVGTNVSVQFSEPVTLGANAIEIECAVSGLHTFAQSGSGNSYTFNPDSDFASGETCTVSITGTAVTDLDGTPDAMPADYQFGFSTAGDTLPSVISSAPANNAVGFPRGANLQLGFSEPVTLDAGWYAISCASSGTHAATVGGGGANWSLDPTTDFTALEHCTLTVYADHVHDQDGTIQQMASDFVLAFDTGADSSDYYAGVDLTSAAALKSWLHNRIKDHTAYAYSGGGTDTWAILKAADEDPLNSSNILDVYKNQSYPKGSGWNREHTWPNSHGFNDVLTSNGHPYPPYTDCHMLYASDIGYNSDRGNKPYGTCTSCTERTTLTYNGFGGAGHSNFFNASVFQAWDHRKGDVARAVLYMDVRYKGGTNAQGQQEPDLQVTDNAALITTTPSGSIAASGYMGLKSVLLDWNDQDPPDAGELLRNEAVYSYQHNRNPFIDHPEWARCVFNGTGCPVVSDVIFANGFQ